MDTDLLPRQGLILCAVSGGADSVYLLRRLLDMGYTVAAGHYNHGLRGDEADRDEAFVRALCRDWGVPFYSEKGDVAALAAREGMGLEEAARQARYDFLERTAQALGAAVIATAHTADDNAETLLLHLARGTGLKGLGGIPPKRGRIVRPMLDVTRGEVEAFLHSRDIRYVTDGSNLSDRFARNRLRRMAMPALGTVSPAYARAMGRTAALLREDEAFLEGLARDLIREHGDGMSLDAAALTAAPWPVASRAVRIMAGRELGYGHGRAALRAAAAGGTADVPGVRIGHGGGRLWFGADSAPALPARPVPVPGQVALPEAGLVLRAEKFTDGAQVVYNSYNIFFFQYENICGSIAVAGRRPGDKLRPVGRGCTKQVRRLLAERGVPAWLRDSVPVLRDDAGVLAVYGAGADERAAVRDRNGPVIKIELLPA